MGQLTGPLRRLRLFRGVAGAKLATGVVIVLGMANLIADGFSMAASN